jgi:hypothetical protein
MTEEKRQPWMKWFPRDWRGDGALRMCSFAARGLWADLLSLIHDHGAPYGHLTINGAVPTTAQLARMLGGSPREIENLTGELEQAGVFDRSVLGAIVCRRMVRDKAKADRDRENGKTGGNPKVKGDDKPPDNGGVNPQDKGRDKAHIPDARSQSSSLRSEDPVPSEPPGSAGQAESHLPAKQQDQPAAQAKPGDSPIDLKQQLWTVGLAFLAKHGVVEARARPLLGKWRKLAGDVGVINALARAEAECASEPIAFIEGCLRNANRKQAAAIDPVEQQRERRAAILRGVALADGQPAPQRQPAGDAGGVVAGDHRAGRASDGAGVVRSLFGPDGSAADLGAGLQPAGDGR